jgi:hypothetical protein
MVERGVGMNEDSSCYVNKRIRSALSTDQKMLQISSTDRRGVENSHHQEQADIGEPLFILSAGAWLVVS